MQVAFTESAWDNYLWSQGQDRKLLNRINALIKDVMRLPFEGIKKPEALKANLSGYWLRRINDEHRLVYSAGDQGTLVIACRYHYET